MSFLELKNVSKSYGKGVEKTEVLSNINLSIEEGEFVAIVGFSGSGKTTLISAIAGLIEPDEGEITLKGKKIDGAGPERGLVFQSYSLFPWMTVHGNVALAVDQVFGKKSASERKAHTDKYIAMVGLDHAASRYPSELSGGMRQRVAVARALAMRPEIILLDEPLSALDALTRANLQDEIAHISQEEKKTIILITNDVDEAILLADRIIPLTPGPNAELGPDFIVDIERPRDRTAMNHNEAFKVLRRDVTKYLMDVGIKAGVEDESFQLPNVQPISVGQKNKLPKAALEVAKAKSLETDRYVEFSKVFKVYPTPEGPLTVVDDFNLKLRQGEFISVIGHSGCGKSTVLTMAAGLNDVTKGAVILDGREVASAGPDRGVVFQAPSLFPWLSARENVALGVERVYPHASAAERKDIIEYYLSRVGLGDSMDKKAAGLSNGMKQRVGIARAFALSPKLLLLDEPFGMLDSLTRWELQEVLMDVWKKTQVTAICVTHDVDEAILLADRVIMMSNGPHATVGKILEVDLPRPRTRKALLEHPRYYELREQLLTFLEEYEGGDPVEEETSKEEEELKQVVNG
ncbi:Nitrate transport ATP-binding subunits C and D [Candidatus Terasakiella magnetica]|uniref:Nitrate transport ATP-binding subunits C and D n=1 Tax=Candidatus Terasakiella magnetica TaxID=1867952 RepID=A0A1C3RFF8_9PROT|nr:nitrate ABC transporter ATP-binding protein [Candidatus Terasakiella magnetica]SCA55998.1 Nitrate transport ATP-binding subunits C and D [Candidatus Terasakiella magnetica]